MNISLLDLPRKLFPTFLSKFRINLYSIDRFSIQTNISQTITKHKSTFTLITATKVLFWLCMLLLPLGASAQSDIINIPDANFRKYLVKKFDTNKDRKISLSEAAAAKEIYVYDDKVSNMQGIEYFTELESLTCHKNNLTSLDLSKNKALKTLLCSRNNLTSLDLSNNTALTELECDNNNLTSLDLSNNTALTELECNDNKLTSLDVSNNKALKKLSCPGNKITSLDVSNNQVLTELWCNRNSLTSLDVSNNRALTGLSCGANKIASLDVSNNQSLTVLQCDYANISSLDVSENTALTELLCNDNKLTSLDVSNNKALKVFDCKDNPNLTDIYVWAGWSMSESLSRLGEGYRKDYLTKFITSASSRPTLANSSPSSTASTVTTTTESQSTSSPQASQASLDKVTQGYITLGDNCKLLGQQAYLGHKNLAAITGNDSYMPIALLNLGQQYNEAMKFYQMAAEKGSQMAMQRINDLLSSYQTYGMQQPVVQTRERHIRETTAYEDKCPSCLGFRFKPNFAPYGGRGAIEYCNKCGRTDTRHDHDVCTRCNGTGTITRTRLE